MNRSLCFLALLLGAATASAAEPPAHATRDKAVAECNRPACAYLADVEVSLGGVVRHGRIIVTPDGVHIEHLDDEARRWVRTAIRPEAPAPTGWDDRARRAAPVQRVWGRLGPNVVLAEAYAPDASLKVSQHKLLAAR